MAQTENRKKETQAKPIRTLNGTFFLRLKRGRKQKKQTDKIVSHYHQCMGGWGERCVVPTVDIDSKTLDNGADGVLSICPSKLDMHL